MCVIIIALLNGLDVNYFIRLLQVRVASNSRNSAWAAFDGRNRREIKQGDRLAVRVLCHRTIIQCCGGL